MLVLDTQQHIFKHIRRVTIFGICTEYVTYYVIVYQNYVEVASLSNIISILFTKIQSIAME